MKLIDADTLKENISKEITKEFIHWDNKLIVIELKTFTNNIIDNAPTVLCDNYSMGYQDGVRKVLSELAEQGQHEFGNIFGDCKPTFVPAIREEQEND